MVEGEEVCCTLGRQARVEDDGDGGDDVESEEDLLLLQGEGGTALEPV